MSYYIIKGYMGLLEVHCTFDLLGNCSYNLKISSITITTLDILGL